MRSRSWAGPACIVCATIGACATPKAPLAEPQAPAPFASVVIECPPTLTEKDAEEGGVSTSSVELPLSFVRDGGESFHIEGACARTTTRPLHLPPGPGRLAASYEERVKQRSSVLETRVSCELPTLSQEWAAGRTYLYRVTIGKRDTHGRFQACNVSLGEAQPAGTPSASASTGN